MQQRSKHKDEREIRGEIEGYSQKVTPFPGNRGARGIKIEGEFHNIVGDREFLENLDNEFPKGDFIKFITIKNKKGYWDVSAPSLKLISKDEAYGHMDQRIITDEEPVDDGAAEYDHGPRRLPPRNTMDGPVLRNAMGNQRPNIPNNPRFDRQFTPQDANKLADRIVDKVIKDSTKEDFIIVTKAQAEGILKRFETTPGLIGVKIRKDVDPDDLLGICSVMIFSDRGAQINSNILPKNPKVAMRVLADLIAYMEIAKDSAKKQLNQFMESIVIKE